jgi:two-component system nitrate/nitrite response regulator NarL
MPGLGGPEVLEAVRRDGSATRIIFLSAYSDPRTIYAAIADGAAGYLVKEADRQTILDTVAAVSRGEVVLSPELQKDLAGQIRLRETRDATGLTAREMQVLREIAEGRSAPEIADRLILSTSTVKSHLQSIYEKLGVSDRAAAVAVGMRRRLLE